MRLDSITLRVLYTILLMDRLKKPLTFLDIAKRTGLDLAGAQKQLFLLRKAGLIDYLGRVTDTVYPRCSITLYL